MRVYEFFREILSFAKKTNLYEFTIIVCFCQSQSIIKLTYLLLGNDFVEVMVI